MCCIGGEVKNYSNIELYNRWNENKLQTMRECIKKGHDGKITMNKASISKQLVFILLQRLDKKLWNIE